MSFSLIFSTAAAVGDVLLQRDTQAAPMNPCEEMEMMKRKDGHVISPPSAFHNLNHNLDQAKSGWWWWGGRELPATSME